MDLRGNVSFVADSFLACLALVASDSADGLTGTRTGNRLPSRKTPKSRKSNLSFLAGAVALAAVAAMPAREARADFISDTLGTAGPSNYAILFLSTSGQPAMNGPGTTTGNVGYNGTSSLQLNASNTAPIPNIAIDGNLYLGNSATVNNSAQVNGTIFTNQDVKLSQANTDALNAASTFAALAGTSIGAVNGTTTISAANPGGVNVLTTSGINLGNGQSLTLNGPAGTEFIINDSGDITLNSGLIHETGGLSEDDVVFNITDSGGKLQTSGGLNNESVIDGIFLQAFSGGQVGMSPGKINGELITGANSPQIVSGGEVVGFPAVPEPASLSVLALGAMGLLLRRRRRICM